jgi:GLPGLI family protein
MKKLLTLIILISSFAQAQVYEIDLTTQHQTIYTPEAKEKFYGHIKDAESKKWNIEQNENPPSIDYEIFLNKDNMSISELEKINNSQNEMGSIKKSVPFLPFNKTSVNIKDGFALRPVDVYGKNYIEKAELQNLEWKLVDEHKDILGYKTQKAVSKFMNFDVIIWFTKEINIDFIPAYNIKPTNGFVLEMYYIIQNDAGEMRNSIKVTSVKEINKKVSFKYPNTESGKKNNIVTSEELDKIYEEANNKRNAMYNQEGVDKK